MKDKIMPPLVLTIICIVVSGLLVLAYNATYVDNTGVLTDDMKKGCEEIFGKGDYEIMLDGEGDSKTPVTFDTEGVNSIITDRDNGRRLFKGWTSSAYRYKQRGNCRGDRISLYRRNSGSWHKGAGR